MCRCIGGKFSTILQLAADGLIDHGYGRYILLIYLRDKITVCDFGMFFLWMDEGIEYGYRYDYKQHI